MLTFQSSNHITIKIVFLQRPRSRGILAAENIAKDGDAPTLNGQITIVI